MRFMKFVLFAAALLTAWPAFADSQGSATGGTAGTQSTGAGCIQQSPALSAGQQVTLSCDTSGNLKVTVTSGSSTQNVAVVAVTHIQTSSLASNLVVKNAAGNLYSFEISADSTLSGAAWWVMIFDATSAPADGAVTPAECYAMPSGATNISGEFVAPASFANGIVIVASTNGCFTKAASVHAFIGATYK